MLLLFCAGYCLIWCGERRGKGVTFTTSIKQPLSSEGTAAFPSSPPHPTPPLLLPLFYHIDLGCRSKGPQNFREGRSIMRDQKNFLEWLCHQRKALDPLVHRLLFLLKLHMHKVLKSQTFLLIKKKKRKNSYICPRTHHFPLLSLLIFICFPPGNMFIE